MSSASSSTTSSGLSSPSRTALGIGLGIALLLLCSAAYMLLSRGRRKSPRRNVYKGQHFSAAAARAASSTASSVRPLMPEAIPLTELPRKTSLVISKPSSVYSSSSPRGARSLALDIETRDSDAGTRKMETELRRQQDLRDVVDMYRVSAVREPEKVARRTAGSVEEGGSMAEAERLREFQFPFGIEEVNRGRRKDAAWVGNRSCPTLKEWPG